MMISSCKALREILSTIGMCKTAFSLRRLIVDVDRDALVLEIGSGNKPYPRSDILLDASLEDYERAGNLVIDRPLVIGIGEYLPFKDKSFDYVIASHVLEHTSYPRLFIEEMMRVGKAGYIEVPAAWIERLNSWEIHRSKISAIDGVLVIREKNKPICDEFVTNSFLERVFKERIWRRFMNRYPWLGVYQYHWYGSINYQIINEGASLNWRVPMVLKISSVGKKGGFFLKVISSKIRWTFARCLFAFARRHYIELLSILRCVECGSEYLIEKQDKIVCSKCQMEYEYRSGIPQMTAKNIRTNLRYEEQ